MPELSGTLSLPAAITSRMRLPDEASDAELMQRTAGGDREAFAQIYRRHSATVYRFARLMTGCAAAAEDVVQEAFLALMRDAGRYDPGRAALSTYLYGVARHQTRRRLSRDRRFVPLTFDGTATEPAAALPDAAQSLERQDEIGRLRCAILTLPSRYREAVVLCELQDLSYADAATVMGCAIGTVRSRLHRARALLGEKMQRAAARGGESAMRCAV
jgi:RNA polymerase sigma-70 factor (ECF subfamily)